MLVSKCARCSCPGSVLVTEQDDLQTVSEKLYRRVCSRCGSPGPFDSTRRRAIIAWNAFNDGLAAHGTLVSDTEQDNE